MTNFIYNMQDELFHLNMILPVGEFSPIMKLVDHIEAQGKQLRELNAAIAKRDKTIEKYEREKETLQKSKEENERLISAKNTRIILLEQKLKNMNKEPSEYIRLELVCHKHEETIEHLEKALEKERRANKDLNVIINNKNKLLDEYMTKYNTLERDLKNYIKENTELRARLVRIGGLSGAINKIIKE